MCVRDGNFIKWAHASSSLFNQLSLHCFVLLPNFCFQYLYSFHGCMAPKPLFDNFWSILLTNSYDIQLSLATSIICRLSHLNTHTTTNNNFQDMRQRLASSSTHPCSEPRYTNENVIFKRNSLLTPLSNVNFGVSPSEIFFYTCYCLLDRCP